MIQLITTTIPSIPTPAYQPINFEEVIRLSYMKTRLDIICTIENMYLYTVTKCTFNAYYLLEIYRTLMQLLHFSPFNLKLQCYITKKPHFMAYVL